MKIVFEYNTTAEGDTLSTNIQADKALFADENVQRGCYEIIKNAALYIDVQVATAILSLLNAIDMDKQETK